MILGAIDEARSRHSEQTGSISAELDRLAALEKRMLALKNKLAFEPDTESVNQ